VLEARRRPVVGLDDFSAWLLDLEGSWNHYIQAIKSIDVTFYTLTELRKELTRVLTLARNFA
jgi:hypothetical protein